MNLLGKCGSVLILGLLPLKKLENKLQASLAQLKHFYKGTDRACSHPEGCIALKSEILNIDPRLYFSRVIRKFLSS